MAGYENIKDKGFDNRTTGELREIAIKGGKASGEARRRKADFRKTLNMLLTAEIDSEEWKPVLEALGVECTLESAMLMAQIKEASCKFSDSILTDEESERQQDRQDVSMGVMSHAEYRAKWYGETLEEAEENLPAQSQVME